VVRLAGQRTATKKADGEMRKARSAARLKETATRLNARATGLNDTETWLKGGVTRLKGRIAKPCGSAIGLKAGTFRMPEREMRPRAWHGSTSPLTL
jgi:capsid protein